MLTLGIVGDHLPYPLRNKELTVRRLDLFLQPRNGVPVLAGDAPLTVSLPDNPQTIAATLTAQPEPAGVVQP